MELGTEVQEQKTSSRAFVLGSLSLGHGVAHMLSQGFNLLLPEIANSMGLGTFQKAAIFAGRQAGSGAVNLGGGPLVDMLKSQWGLILTACMVVTALSLVMIGTAPNFTVLIVASTLFFIPGTLWHLPAAAAISQRYPDRRGFAISVHGSVANIGTVIGPLTAGALLGVLVWETIAFIYIAPAAVAAVFVWWTLRSLGKEGRQEKQARAGQQFRDTGALLKDRVILSLIFAAILRGVAISALFNWTPFYLRDPVAEGGLGMGSFEAGFHFSLLIGAGIVSMPVLGALSDRYGRKQILVPGLAISGVLSMLVVPVGDGLLLIPVFIGVGLFAAALQQILRAGLLDMVSQGSEAKAIGLISGLNGLVGIGTPFLASLVINYLSLASVYYYSGIMTFATVLLISMIPMTRVPRNGAAPASPS